MTSHRLVLASPPVTLDARYGKLAGAGSTEPSFGLVCLAAAARARGHEVAIVEASAQGLSMETAARRIVELHPTVLGLTATTSGIVAAAELAARVKSSSPRTLCLIGGCHATALPELTLTEFSAFDLAVVGEGERTLQEILSSPPGQIPSGIPGTAERDDHRVRRNAARELIANLDDLPLPDWSLLEGFPSSFRPSPARIRRWPCASLVLTRGCPNSCTFCDRSVFGNRCRAYSPDYTLRLLKDLRHTHGVREVLIEDDTFTLSSARVRETCERMLAERLDLSWSCLGRADRVDLETLRLMHKAGCWHISFGIESGDETILRNVRKQLDTDRIRQALRWCRQAGIQTKGFFIVGLPGETADTLRKTAEFARSLPLDDITAMQFTPFPGSALYDEARKFGDFQQDWRKMNTLNTVFVPYGLTSADLEKASRRLFREFYLQPGILGRKTLHLLRNPGLTRHYMRGIAALMRL